MINSGFYKYIVEEEEEVERECLLGEEGKREPNMVTDDINEVEDDKLTVEVPETAHQISTGMCLVDCSFFFF